MILTTMRLFSVGVFGYLVGEVIPFSPSLALSIGVAGLIFGMLSYLEGSKDQI